jgi:hypothetical protein
MRNSIGTRSGGSTTSGSRNRLIIILGWVQADPVTQAVETLWPMSLHCSNFAIVPVAFGVGAVVVVVMYTFVIVFHIVVVLDEVALIVVDLTWGRSVDAAFEVVVTLELAFDVVMLEAITLENIALVAVVVRGSVALETLL